MRDFTDQLAETRKREAEAAVLEAQNRAMAKAALADAERVEAERRASVEAPAKADKARAIVDRDREWTSHCYIKEYPLAIARGSGVMVEDVDGNRYLDFMAGIAVASTGYGHPEVVRAVQDAARQLRQAEAPG